MNQQMKLTRRAALAGLGGALAAPAIRPSFAQTTPIKVGVLHSLSGTMAISETALRDTVLMMCEWQNSRGGILGRRL
jgi:urea transport system substrate-binding protein